MRLIDSAIGALWIAFGVYWIASATRAKASRRPSRGFIGARVLVSLVIVVLIRAGVLGRSALNHNRVSGFVGLVLLILGTGFAVWARRHIGRNWGMPMTQRVAPELVTSGPYRFVRHPIYTGIIVAMAGTAIAVSVYALIPAALLAGYFVYSARSEERFLRTAFPDTYPPYCRGTKMLVPFVY